jgi:rubredoxin
MIVEAETYTCSVCREAYRKTRSDEEVDAEYEAGFAEFKGQPRSIVCDDCYQQVLGWIASRSVKQ